MRAGAEVAFRLAAAIGATDACDFGIGAVLMQDKRPVAFGSRKLIPAELNYTTTEKECLCCHSCIADLEVLP